MSDKKYNPLTPDFFDDKTDSIKKQPKITSSRTFGVELEIYGGIMKKLTNYAQERGHTYGHDGSIKNEDNTNDGCVEVQTAILQGKEGAEKLAELMNKCRDYGFRINGTCGTHVHFGGADFFDKAYFSLGSLKDLKHSDQTNIIFEKKLLLLMIESFGSFENTVSKVIGDISYSLGKPYTNEYQMTTGKYSRFCVVPVVYFGEKYHFVVRESTLTKMGTSQKESWSKLLYITDDNSSYKTIKTKDVVLVYKPETDKFKKLKKLFYFYTVFNNVLFSMLPKERRSNNFCKKLSSSYNIKDIEKCNSQGELEKIWYQKDSFMDVERAKSSSLQGNSSDSRNRDSSVRYHSINFHSLYYKHGTVEVRMHHGTLNAESMLLWIQLHQRIMDGIIDNSVSDEAIALCARGYEGAYEGGQLLIDALQVRGTELEDFINHRITKYN